MTPRDRRALILGGGIVLAAILLLRVLPWAIRSTVAAERDLATKTALLSRARAELVAEPGLADSARKLQGEVVNLAGRILAGRSRAEALADLSQRVELLARRNRARVLRTEQLNDSAVAGQLRQAAVTTSIETDIGGLASFLAAMEREPVILSPVRMQVLAAGVEGGQREPEVLRAEIRVEGWYQAATEAP